jgi:tRNA(Arg) A34 adenosine deaminase TadA
MASGIERSGRPMQGCVACQRVSIGYVRSMHGKDQSPSAGMAAALVAAREAGRRSEVPVGAAIVGPDGVVVAAEGNRTRALADPTAHAEILAIRAACAAVGSERLDGYDLYVTLEPCAMCAGAISAARLRRLYYGAPDPKSGGVEHGARVFASPTCHHCPDVYGGISATAAAEMLKTFFAKLR